MLVAVILFSVRGKGGDSGLFYIKDGEVYYSDLGKKSQPWRVTSDFNLLGTDSAGSIATMFPYIGAVASFTDDGKYVVYLDNSDEDSDGCDLYIKKPGGAGSQSEKIASDVVMYSVEGSQITYIREDGGSGALYQYNISKGSKDKVTNDDVSFYMVADGGRKLLFFVDETQSYNLYYYDGSKSELISKDYYSSRKSASGAAVLVFRESKTSEPEKIKFSEMEDYYTSMYSIESEIEERTRTSTETRIAVGKNVSPMNSDTRIGKISINKDGSLLYYCDADGVLSRVKIRNGKPGSPEKYDDDVSYMRFVGKSKIAYLKAYNDNEGDLYIDKKKVDSEATYNTLINLKYKGDADSVYYFAGLNPYGIGTLKRFKGGKSEKIADDAFYNIKLLGDDKVLYLYDYSGKSHTGELCLWEKGKQRKIDDDVICMLSNTPMWSAEYSRWY